MQLMQKRIRPAITITLNPVLVAKLKAYGEAKGETRLSALIDRCMEHFLEFQDGPSATNQPVKKARGK